MQRIQLDRIDRKILAHLQTHARASNVELAEAVNLSAPQCYRRLKRLEQTGAIVAYEARLAPARLGFGVVTFIHLSTDKGRVRDLSKFEAMIAALPHVQECYAVTGDFDYVLKVVARDLQALSDFLMETLMKLPGVTAVRFSVCLREVKCTGALPL